LVADIEDDIVDSRAQIIWVLEQDPQGAPGTADSCTSTMDQLGAKDQGFCVGDSQTMPEPGTFDDSPFSVARGFDMIVPRSSMQIVWSTSHGTPSGNDNLDGEDVLAKVREVVDGL
jgi:hypothetical protein